VEKENGCFNSGYFPSYYQTLLGISLVSYLTSLPSDEFLHIHRTVAMSALVWVLASLFRGKKLLPGSKPLAPVLLSRLRAADPASVIPRGQPLCAQANRKKGDPGMDTRRSFTSLMANPKLSYPIGWLNQFREFDQQGIPFVPWWSAAVHLSAPPGLFGSWPEPSPQMHIQMLNS